MADLIDADDPDGDLGPLEWLERPRGHACPHCAAHIGYGSAMAHDKAAHTGWHDDLEKLHAKIIAAVETTAEVFANHHAAPAHEPKD